MRFKQLGYLFAILLLAFILRFYRFEFFPVVGETQDEIAWSYLGASLIEDGQPTSWSFFDAYHPDYVYELRGDEGQKEAPLVRPVLDHPPIFSFFPGVFHSLKSSWQEFPSIKVIRFPVVLLGVINVALLFFCARKYLKSDKWAYLATLIYATVPTFVFASRLVVAENLIVTWSLLALIILGSKKVKHQVWWLSLIGVLSVLTKVSGLVVPLSILVYGLKDADKSVIKSGVIGLVGGVSAFATYGAIYNFDLFVQIIFSQAGRDLGFLTLHNRFFLHPSVVEKIFFDGWIILGLISLGISIFQNRAKLLAINIFSITNLLFIVATSGENTFHGWYDYPLYPLFAILIANFFYHLLSKRNYLLVGFVWLVLLPVFRLTATYGGWYTQLSPFMIRAVMGLGFVPFLFSLKKNVPSKVLEKSLFVLLIVVFFANVYVVFSVSDVTYWEMDSAFRTQWCADLI